MVEIKGIYPAFITPFTKSGEINVDRIGELIEYQIGAGVDGFYVGGGDW